MAAKPVKHCILGAGPAGIIAAETLKRRDPQCVVTIVGNESESPYSRMALPYLLAGNIAEPGTFLRRGPGHFVDLGIEVRHGEAVAVDTRAGQVTLADGEPLAYDKLLIATGSSALRPPIAGMELPAVENCWTLADARRIAERATPGSEVVLLGAGFIGCIVLEALAARGVRLTVVEMADRMLARMMDDAGAAIIKQWCEARGVRVLTGTEVSAVTSSDGRLSLETRGGEALAADLIVCAAGVQPNTAFLAGSGIAVDTGVLVDAHLCSSDANVFAAGDVAEGFEFDTGARAVHAIQPVAADHGRIAALNMAGESTRYHGALPMNVLNTLGLVSSAFGQWQGVAGGERAIAHDPGRSRYLRLEFDGDRVVGALALGLTEHVGVLRGLIQTRVPLAGWKKTLLDSPLRIVEAYLDRTHGGAQRAQSGAGAARAA